MARADLDGVAMFLREIICAPVSDVPNPSTYLAPAPIGDTAENPSPS